MTTQRILSSYMLMTLGLLGAAETPPTHEITIDQLDVNQQILRDEPDLQRLWDSRVIAELAKRGIRISQSAGSHLRATVKESVLASKPVRPWDEVFRPSLKMTVFLRLTGVDKQEFWTGDVTALTGVRGRNAIPILVDGCARSAAQSLAGVLKYHGASGGQQ